MNNLADISMDAMTEANANVEMSARTGSNNVLITN